MCPVLCVQEYLDTQTDIDKSIQKVIMSRSVAQTHYTLTTEGIPLEIIQSTRIYNCPLEIIQSTRIYNWFRILHLGLLKTCI